MTYSSETYTDLIGKTFTSVIAGVDEMTFKDTDGLSYIFYHQQDCCESVEIDDIVGDLADLVGSPLLQAEESTKEEDYEYGTKTWTFYKFATIKGYVTVKWFGESNGYYSEAVYFRKEKAEMLNHDEKAELSADALKKYNL